MYSPSRSPLPLPSLPDPSGWVILFEVDGQVSTCGGGVLSNCIGQRLSTTVAMCGGLFSRCGVWVPL